MPTCIRGDYRHEADARLDGVETELAAEVEDWDTAFGRHRQAVDAARAAVEASPDGWFKLDEVPPPKDGRRLMIYLPPGNAFARGLTCVTGWSRIYDRLSWDGPGQPTHWRPMPEPPVTASEPAEPQSSGEAAPAPSEPPEPETIRANQRGRRRTQLTPGPWRGARRSKERSPGAG